MTTTIRRPAVAGRFYPGDAAELGSTVARLLAQARAGRAIDGSPPPVPKALVAPHAGYIYSGSTAAQAYVTVDAAKDTITRVVLLGPAHYVRVAGLALSGSDGFATPLGDVAVDRTAESELLALPQVATDPVAHGPEHSLEVHLPFLQRVLTGFEVVPVLVGAADPGQVAAVLEALWGGPETLLLISSDLSHYLPYAHARATDQDTVQRILDLAWPLPDRSACGARPVSGLLVTAAHHGLRPRLLGMCNSGDTAGDRSRVVGYAAIAFEEDGT